MNVKSKNELTVKDKHRFDIVFEIAFIYQLEHELSEVLSVSRPSNVRNNIIVLVAYGSE